MTSGKAYPQAAATFQTAARIDARRGDDIQPRSGMTGTQQAVEIGQTIPIIWTNRVGNIGGVWIAPPASEAAFRNGIDNGISCLYQLVLGEGPIGTISASNVYQGPRRVGAIAQANGSRAGVWLPRNDIYQRWREEDYEWTVEASAPENETATVTVSSKGEYVTRMSISWTRLSGPFSVLMPDWTYGAIQGLETNVVTKTLNEIGTVKPEPSSYRARITETDEVPLSLPEVPRFLGTGGSYSGLAMASFAADYRNEEDGWRDQVFLFVTNGLQVDRLLGGTGGSNNFADLVRYAMTRSGRIPADLIDIASLTAAAAFTDVQAMWFNGILASATNVPDMVTRLCPYFLLRPTVRGGKHGLRPVLPIDGSNQFSTLPVSPVLTFTSEDVVSYSKTYVPLSERKDLCLLMTWRDQSPTDIGLMRTTEVRYTGKALNGPYETHDLSDFCASEAHAIRAAKYLLARRKWVTHTLEIEIRPTDDALSLGVGDIVALTMPRRNSEGDASTSTVYYWVDAIEIRSGNPVRLSLTHFPTNGTGQSLIALDMVGTSSSGVTGGTSGGRIIGTVSIIVGQSYEEEAGDAGQPLGPFVWNWQANYQNLTTSQVEVIEFMASIMTTDSSPYYNFLVANSVEDVDFQAWKADPKLWLEYYRQSVFATAYQPVTQADIKRCDYLFAPIEQTVFFSGDSSYMSLQFYAPGGTRDFDDNAPSGGFLTDLPRYTTLERGSVSTNYMLIEANPGYQVFYRQVNASGGGHGPLTIAPPDTVASFDRTQEQPALWRPYRTPQPYPTPSDLLFGDCSYPCCNPGP